MDFHILDEVIVVRDSTKLWEESSSALVSWMNQRYAKNKGIDEIDPKSNDSCGWKAILKNMTKIKK